MKMQWIIIQQGSSLVVVRTDEFGTHAGAKYSPNDGYCRVSPTFDDVEIAYIEATRLRSIAAPIPEPTPEPAPLKAAVIDTIPTPKRPTMFAWCYLMRSFTGELVWQVGLGHTDEARAKRCKADGALPGSVLVRIPGEGE